VCEGKWLWIYAKISDIMVKNLVLYMPKNLPFSPSIYLFLSLKIFGERKKKGGERERERERVDHRKIYIAFRPYM
jgi:hypothetical protein